MSRELVIVGNGQMAELFCSQFTHNTDYRVAGFSIGRELVTGDELLGLPLVPQDVVYLGRSGRPLTEPGEPVQAAGSPLSTFQSAGRTIGTAHRPRLMPGPARDRRAKS
jgi:hypothetical protein